MFYNQPLVVKFGNVLNEEISNPQWTSIKIAVAWARRSGIRHLKKSIIDYLSRGNELRVIVGIDLENTTYEGLQELLSFERSGNIKTFVYHNEGNSIFHPKVFLFSSVQQVRIIVGSNNLTENGLYRNTEAAIDLLVGKNDSNAISSIEAFRSWTSGALGLCKELDVLILDKLRELEYVPKEGIESSPRRKTSQEKALAEQDRIFGSVFVSAPIIRIEDRLPTTRIRDEQPMLKSDPDELEARNAQLLLMRIRKAQIVNRPTQTQIPIRVTRDSFFAGVTEVVSDHTGVRHVLHKANARNAINTIKLEIPEMKTFSDPVLRLEKSDNEIKYQVYEAMSDEGIAIMRRLEEGLESDPTETFLTLPSNPQSATWWRFCS